MRPDKLYVQEGSKMRVNVTVISSVLIAGVFLLVTSCATKSSGAECEYLPGMLAYWKLDEGEGNTARDSVNGNDGIIYGATWVPGQVGTALSFDGTDDRVQIPSQVISGTTMTLNLWVKTNDDRFGLISGANWKFDNEYVLYVHGTTDMRGLEIYYHDNQGWYGDGFYLTNIIINDNSWHMITVVTEVSRTMIYVDGSLREITDPPYGSENSFNVEGLWLGAEQDCVDDCWDPRQQLNGVVDEIAIYNRALSPKEIKRHYSLALEGMSYCER
jgi:hypothetical protein